MLGPHGFSFWSRQEISSGYQRGLAIDKTCGDDAELERSTLRTRAAHGEEFVHSGGDRGIDFTVGGLQVRVWMRCQPPAGDTSDIYFFAHTLADGILNGNAASDHDGALLAGLKQPLLLAHAAVGIKRRAIRSERKALARGGDQHQANFCGNNVRRGTFGGRCQQRREENQYGLVHFFSGYGNCRGLLEIGTAQERERRRKFLMTHANLARAILMHENRERGRFEKSGAMTAPESFPAMLKTLLDGRLLNVQRYVVKNE